MYRLHFCSFLFFFSIIILSPTHAFNPDSANHVAAVDTMRYWNLTVSGRLGLNQVAFSNWAEGGESNVAGHANGLVRGVVDQVVCGTVAHSLQV